jgi:hypothetical protein
MTTDSRLERSSDENAIYVGYTTEVEPFLLALPTRPNPLGDDVYLNRGSAVFFANQALAQRSHAMRPSIFQNLENLVGAYGSSLVDIYEEQIHGNFPILKNNFFDVYKDDLIELDPTLIAAVYAVSSTWLHSDAVSVSQLDDQAFALLSSSLNAPTIATIQAGLILMQRPGIDPKTLNSQIINAAYELGLHLDCSTWDLPDEDKILRKRLAWALYMQDKWCCLVHGRPSLISTENWVVKDLGEDDFEVEPDESGEVTLPGGHILFKQLINLTKILSLILDTFYTLKAMQEVEDSASNGTRLILERAKPVQISLKEWFSGLPAVLKMDSSVTGKPSAVGMYVLFSGKALISNKSNRLRTSCLFRYRDNSPSMYHSFASNPR